MEQRLPMQRPVGRGGTTVRMAKVQGRAPANGAAGVRACCRRADGRAERVHQQQRRGIRHNVLNAWVACGALRQLTQHTPQRRPAGAGPSA